MKTTFKKMVRSLTGFSTPVFGVSWNPPETDRETLRKVITFLEDRRALYNPYEIETEIWVVRSILEIRKNLTDVIQTLDDSSDISAHLRAMRAACRKFMDEVEVESGHLSRRFPEAFTALGELRGVFGIHIAQLCVKYGVDIEGQLAMILPIADDETKRSRRLGWQAQGG